MATPVISPDTQNVTVHPPRTSHRAALASLLLVGVIYLVCLILLPHDGAQFWSPDEGGKFIQLQNLRLDPGLDTSILYPGLALDPDYHFVPFPPPESFTHDGKLYLQWPPFLPLLTWLPYKLLGGFGLYLLPFLASLATLWLAYLLCRLLLPGAARAWTVIPLLGLTTPLFVYSLVYFEHSLAALLVTLALYAAIRAIGGTPANTISQPPPQGDGLLHPPSQPPPKGEGNGWMLVAGLAMAGAIWLRSELYILALIMVMALALRAMVLRGWRRLGVWLASLLAGLIPLWLFYILTWGSLLPAHALPYFSSGLKARFISTGGLRTFLGSFLLGVRDDLTALPDLGPHIAPALRYAFIIGLALFLLGALLRSGWQRDGLLLAGFAALLATATAVLLDSNGYSALHGFLLPAPALVVATLMFRSTVFRLPASDAPTPNSIHSTFYILHSTFYPLLRSPMALFTVITALYVAAHTLIISVVSGLGPDSRFEWGQRYLLPAYPLVAVLLVAALPRLWLGPQDDGRLRIGGTLLRDLLALALLLSLIVGAGLELRGVVAIGTARQNSAAWSQQVRVATRGLPNTPIVSDVWWLPQEVAGVYGQRRIYLVNDSEQFAAFVQQMKAARQNGFWLLTTASQPPTVAGATPTTDIIASVAGVELIRYRIR